MATADLTSRVTWAGACTVAVMSGGAWWLGGAPVAAGGAGGGGAGRRPCPCVAPRGGGGGAPPVAGGAAVALVSFRWLARDVGRAVSLVIEGRGGLARFGRIGLRQFVTFGGL